jgi:hypothetical protein
MQISQRAFDLIVAEEVSSKAYYIRHYQHPEWPGGASGITIAIGYDLGYATRAKISADWSGRVSSDTLMVMMRCAGVHGDAARQLLPQVRSGINIPWEAAIAVFSGRDVPQWTAAVLKGIPGAGKLRPSCLGTIVSTAYNRGCSFALGGDRYREMRDIKKHVANGAISVVPRDIRAMKRLWPKVKGLRDRREREAVLYEYGLKTEGDKIADVAPTPPAPDPEVPLNEGPARTKPPVTTNAQNGTTGAIVAGTVAGAQQAHTAGFPLGTVIVFAALGIIVAGIVWLAWYRNRNPS